MSDDKHKLTQEQIVTINELMKDTTETGREVLQNYINFSMVELHKPSGEPEPEPCPAGQHRDPNTGECVPDQPEPDKPTLPNDGREQFHKGANQDANTWNIVNMRDDPTLFKIVDAGGTNVADQFHSQETAQQFIDYYKWLQKKQSECPEGTTFDPAQNKCVEQPGPGPQPGNSTTKDGVQVPFKIKGNWDYDYETDERDGGARYNMNAAGTSLVMVGYFTMSGGSDDVAGKILGGRHTDSAKYDGCIYDPAIQTDNGQPQLRCECPHPDYTGDLDLDFSKQGISYHGKWVGTMVAATQEAAGVRIQMFQDQGDNESTPANQWVKVLEFFDDGTKVSGIEGADRFPIRELPGSAQNTWRIDESPGLREKWLAIAEIDVSGNPTPGPDPNPGPQPVPGKEFPYAAIGQPMQSTQRGPTTRHYRSGKEDDETIEKNVKNIKFKNYQWVCYVTMHEIEHDDTLSVKFGGTHTGSGWLDHGISFESGQCCMGKEEDHPSTDLCVKEGPKLGSILEKKVGIAGVYFTDENFSELWIDMGDGWKKQMEAKDLGGFNPGSDEDEAQLRIDGFKEGSVPTIHSAVVTEIADTGARVSTVKASSGEGTPAECSDDLD